MRSTEQNPEPSAEKLRSLGTQSRQVCSNLGVNVSRYNQGARNGLGSTQWVLQAPSPPPLCTATVLPFPSEEDETGGPPSVGVARTTQPRTPAAGP